MPKKRRPEEPDNFYLELSLSEADPFNDLTTDIQDDHENSDYDQIRGLSDEQVSQIARDALEQTHSGSYGQNSSSDQDSFQKSKNH